MARYRKHSMASAIAVAVGLTACGGGGGGGGGVAFTPPPPATPTPTPTPTPTAAVVGPAAPAVIPSAGLFPQASTGGPTMQAHSTTAFPMLQTVMRTSVGSGGATGSASAATDVMAGGATLTFNSTGNIVNDQFKFSVPVMNVNDMAMAAGGWYCYAVLCGGAAPYFEITMQEPAKSNLSWTAYGDWASYSNAQNHYAPFVMGYATPAGSVPTTGTASYAGSVQGRVYYPSAGSNHGVGFSSLSGNAALQANFGAASITGSLTGMTINGSPWNSVSLLGAIHGGANGFSGTTAVTSAPGGVGRLSASATGSFAGMFFGPNAQELGAVWTLHDGTSTAVGSIGAKRP